MPPRPISVLSHSVAFGPGWLSVLRTGEVVRDVHDHERVQLDALRFTHLRPSDFAENNFIIVEEIDYSTKRFIIV